MKMWNQCGLIPVALQDVPEAFFNLGGAGIMKTINSFNEPVFPSMEPFAKAAEAGEGELGPTKMRMMNIHRNALQKAYLDRWNASATADGKPRIDGIIQAVSPWAAPRLNGTQTVGLYAGYTCVWNLLGELSSLKALFMPRLTPPPSSRRTPSCFHELSSSRPPPSSPPSSNLLIPQTRFRFMHIPRNIRGPKHRCSTRSRELPTHQRLRRPHPKGLRRGILPRRAGVAADHWPSTRGRESPGDGGGDCRCSCCGKHVKV